MGTSTRALLVAFFAVVAAFIGSTVWSQRAARGIDADTLLISRDAAPGIEVMSEVRAELRTLEVDALRSIEGRDGALLTQARGRLETLLSRAMALPTDTHEALVLGRMQGDIQAFDVAASHALAQAGAGHGQAARDTLDRDGRPHTDAAAALARDLVDYDARAAQQAAMRIEDARKRANLFAYQLDGLCAVLAVVAAWLALRVVRQVHQVQEEHQRLVERKAEELEQFAGRVAHDILSPLSTVGLVLGIAAKQAAGAQEALARGTSSLNRVHRIVDGLLEFARAGARPEPGAHTEVPPVVAGLEEELAPFAADRQAVLHVEPPPDCAVPCSAGVLLSLLGNLVTNAIKFLGESQVREVSLRVRRRRGRVLFEVEDTGPGIPPSMTDRVFDPYVRGPNTNAPGIGLGLATVKRLAMSHGGTVGVRAGARGGALFWFDLPEAPSLLARLSGDGRDAAQLS